MYTRHVSFVLFVLLILSVGVGLFGCTDTSRGISPDPTVIHYPTGIAIHPSGRYLYIANANFDLAYTGGTVTVFDTDEGTTGVFDVGGIKTELKTLRMVAGATVQIGSFAGQVLLNHQGTRAYVAVRQDKRSTSPLDSSSITILDIDTNATGMGHLKCSETAITKEMTGGVGEEDKFDVTAAPKCGDASKVFMDENPFPYGLALLSYCKARQTCTDDAGCTTANQKCYQGACTGTCNADTDCPQSSSCQQNLCVRTATTAPICQGNSDCAAWEQCEESSLLASHLQTGGLSEITLSAGTTPSERRVSSITQLPGGVTALAVLPGNTNIGGSGEIFLGSRQDNKLYMLPQVPLLNATDLETILISHANTVATTTAADIRGITVGVDTKNKRVRLYVAVRLPSPAVLIYHLERIEGKLTPQLVSYIPVGHDPSHILYRQRPAPEPDLLYVVCSRAGRVDVIDVESLLPLYQIKVGEQPYFIAIHEPKTPNDIQRRRAYVANFLDTTISIIDLDSHRVIGRVTGADTRPPLP